MTVVTTIVLAQACADERLSKGELIARADEICAEADERIRELGRPERLEDVDRFVERASAITRDSIAKIRELPAPEGDEDRIDRMLDKVEEAVGHLPKLADAAKTGDQQALGEEASALQQAAGEARDIAEEYGFQVCGGVATPAPTSP